MAKKQSSPLTNDEFESVYRNEIYSIDDPRYFYHKTTGSRYKIGKNTHYEDYRERKVEQDDLWGET